MRKIKFRGKRIAPGYSYDGEWVYGGIVYQTDWYGDAVDDYYIIDGTETNDYNIGGAYEVDPNTVGQFTGLQDINGNDIYEGDIIFYLAFATHTNDRVVKFHDGAWIAELLRSGYHGLLNEIGAREYEVIGNIHEGIK